MFPAGVWACNTNASLSQTVKMEDPTAVEENGANQSAVQVDEEDVGGIASLEMEKAIADDFNNYDCFMQPFHTLNEEKQKELENTPCDNVDQQQLSSKNTEVCQTVR